MIMSKKTISCRKVCSWSIGFVVLAILMSIDFKFWIYTSRNVTIPEVRIPQGIVRGVSMFTSRYNREFFGFMGIPFAEPPVGNLRFKEPLPAKAWHGTLDASSDSKPCPQLTGDRVIGDEDCLHMNVYTPLLPTSDNPTLLPVMFFIYGGSFRIGNNNSSRWGGYRTMDKNVVQIVPNYRLGVLGFLSTGDEVLPGNNGMKDLVLALEWCRDNIRYFGGDPNQVTIFGFSAGGVLGHLLTLTNATDGLFHRYILQSGSAMSPGAHQSTEVAKKYTILLAEYLGCPTDTSTNLVKCMKSLSVRKLVDSNAAFSPIILSRPCIWGPAVEPNVKGALLTESAVKLIESGKIRDMPRILSLSRDEGLTFSIGSIFAFVDCLLLATGLERFRIDFAKSFYKNETLFEEFLANIDEKLPALLNCDELLADSSLSAYISALKSHYLNDLSADRSLLLSNLTRLLGENTFIYPTSILADLNEPHAKSPQYFCSFGYRGTFSYSYMFSGGSTENWGVAHGEENLYIFHDKNFLFGPPGYEHTESDWKMADMMVQLWTSFAINGVPTISDPSTSVIWEPYSSERKNYLRIGDGSDTGVEVHYNLLEDRFRFWKELNAATKWK